MAKRPIRYLARGSECDSHLSTERPEEPGAIEGAKNALPDASPGRQQRPIQYRVFSVLLAVGEPAAVDLAADLAGMGAQHRANRVPPARRLAEHSFANDRVHIGLAQADTNRKPSEQSLQIVHIGEGLLPCTDKQQPAVKIGPQTLGDAAHRPCLLGVVSEEFLGFIQHDQGEGKLLVVEEQRAPDRRRQIRHRDLGRLREVCLEAVRQIARAVSKIRPFAQNSLMEWPRQDEIANCRLEPGPEPFTYSVENTLVGEPERDARSPEIIRHADGEKDDRSVVSIGLSEPSSRPPPASGAAGASRGGSQRAQPRPQILRHLGYRPLARAPSGNSKSVQRAPKHLGQMRFARAIEAGDPDSSLIAPTERGKKVNSRMRTRPRPYSPSVTKVWSSPPQQASRCTSPL